MACLSATCRSRPRRAGTLVLWLLLAATSVWAVEVAEVRWGFDDRVVPERINLLSLLMVNSANAAFDGPLLLHKEDELGDRRGATLVEPCFIAPFSSRWVQFYPYVSAKGEKWVVTAGRRKTTLPRPNVAAPAVVCLRRADGASGRPSRLKEFPDNLFPATVTATDGLCGLVMDYAPRWEPLKREAFLDWLRKGGTVHLLQSEDGDYPRFSGELAALSNPAPRFRVGAGVVVRHEAPRREVDHETLAKAGLPPPVLHEGESTYGWTLEQAIFQRLSGLVRPEHNWLLIYLLLLTYVAVIGPINYIIARKAKDFRFTVLCFLAAVAVFGLVLSLLGRRGYGETTAVNTLTYARPLGEGEYDVTQWANVFVLSGGNYTIAHTGAHNLYSTCQEYEAVRGLVHSGRQGEFVVDMPLYSSRSYLHRGKAKGHELGLEVAEWEGDGRLERLTLSVGAGFPDDFIEAWAFHGDRFYPMRLKEQCIELAWGQGETIATFLSQEHLDMLVTHYLPYPAAYEPGKKSPAQVFREMVRPLIARSIGGTQNFRHYVDVPPSSADRLQLFIFARSPQEFGLVGKGLGKESGYVLYHLDVFKPGKTDDSDE